MKANPRRTQRSHSLPSSVLDHFAASGLTAEHLQRMQVTYVERSDVPRCPVPSARIPYFDLEGKPTGFARLRALKEWIPDGEHKPRRYVQPKGSGNHMYLPPLLDRSWKEIAADVSVPIAITEGEKKAACACALGIPTIGLGGVWSWKTRDSTAPTGAATLPLEELRWIEWEGRTVMLPFDSPDVYANGKVAAAVQSLATELRGRGARVFFVVLPLKRPETKMGLDDFLVAFGAHGWAELVEARASSDYDIARLNNELAVITVNGKSLVLHEYETRDARSQSAVFTFGVVRAADVRLKYANQYVEVQQSEDKPPKRINAFDRWMAHSERRQLKSIVFDPSAPREINGHYNAWQGFSVEPREGDCSLFLSHVRDVICAGDSALNDYVTAWMAHAVQRPGERPETALVLKGGQGTGKGTFVTEFGRLFGAHFLQVTDEAHVTGNFNAFTKEAIVLFADEAVPASHRSVVSKLKAMVTESVRTIEQKGVDAFHVPNCLRLVMASNYEHVAQVANDDRRFIVIEISERRARDYEYFAALHRQMDNGGREALLHYLQHYDISGVNIKNAPRSDALLKQKLLSMEPLQQFWFEVLQRGYILDARHGWRRVVPTKDVQEACKAALQSTRLRDDRLAFATSLGMLLRNRCIDVGTREASAEESKALAIRRKEPVYDLPSLTEARAQFEKRLQQPIAWHDVDESPDTPTKREPKW